MRAGATIAILALSAAAAVVIISGSAQAASPGIYPVGTTPVALTRPADALLGRMRPTADADTKGMFGPQVGWGVIPIHAAIAPNGHLVTYGSPISDPVQGGVTYDDWNPALGMVDAAHTQAPSMATYDAFCNALVTLSDGRMIMVGGNANDVTSHGTMYYDPISKAESMGPRLTEQRWYATALRRPDDRVAVFGGGDYYAYGAWTNPGDNGPVAITPEIGTGTSAWTQLTGATSTAAFGAQNNRWWYPRTFNAPDGSVFGISAERLWRMSTAGAGSINLQGTLPATQGVSGSAVMYAPGKILVAGGGEIANGTDVSGTNLATVVDINGATNTVTPVAPMTHRRQWNNATVLPNGEVFVNGGTVVGTNGGAANSSYVSETWNPVTQQWRTGSAAQRIRTYHSSAILMPSGMVLTGGGGVPGPEDNFNVEPFYPSSLFTRDANNTVVWASRPELTSIAGDLTWGGQLTLGSKDARTVASVSLVSAGSVTHSLNIDQRRVPLSFTQNGDALRATIPSDRNQVPPGTYLLSAVDSRGVPSPSQLVTIRNGGAGSVNVYEEDRSGVNGVGGPGPVPTGTVPLTIGSSVGFEAVNFPGYRVRQRNGILRIDPVSAASSAADQGDSSFVVRSGLASPTGLSFESVTQPGLFVRVENGVAVLRRNDGTAGFAADATFLAVHGLTGQHTSLALYSNQNLYLRHQGYVLYAQPFDASDLGRKDATFAVRAAFVQPTTPTPSPTTPPGGGLTPPWRSTSSVPATFSQSGSAVSVSAAGADMWIGVDEYGAVYNPSSAGAGSSVVARVRSQTATDPWAKAGVVLRNTMTGARSSPGYAVMVLTPGSGVSFQWDSNGNGDLDSFATAAGGATAPVWLRLTRTSATTVAGSYSSNGTTWTQVGPTAAVPGAAAVQDAGVVMTSHRTGVTGTAVFDSLQVIGSGSPPTLTSTASAPASFSQTADTYTISAAGRDIWVDVDEYGALYSPVSAGAGSSVTARVDSQTATDPWAKAGVVLRNSMSGARTSPGYAVMVLTPGNGVSFQWDSNGNGDLDSFATAARGTTAPVWLRLTRTSATTVAGYYSSSGTSWTQVGATVTVPGAAAVQDAGLIMTSHREGATGTATYSSFGVS